MDKPPSVDAKVILEPKLSYQRDSLIDTGKGSGHRKSQTRLQSCAQAP